uniref:LYR motif containing 1 n=1 Tax=Apteryx owenii TaxID=8824 RepID=A0A8B9S3S6_APTOW
GVSWRRAAAAPRHAPLRDVPDAARTLRAGRARGPRRHRPLPRPPAGAGGRGSVAPHRRRREGSGAPARLFPKVTDPKLIKQCVEECEARIEIGLHYNIPYPRPIHLPPMGLASKQGRAFRHQEKLRKFSKPIYLKSHDDIS